MTPTAPLGLARPILAGLICLGLAVPAAAQERRKHVVLLGIASGTVAPHGMGFASLSGTNNSPAGNTDGSLALGFGLGDANRTVGVQVTAQVTSLTDDFGDSGYLSLKLSRRLGGAPLFLGVQGDHLANWGDSRLIDPSVKVALTYFTSFSANGEQYPVMMTLGGGDRIRNTRSDPGLFAGIGVGLTESFGASVAWSGDYVDIGAGLRLSDRMTVSATLNDAFDQEDRQRITISVNYILPNLFGG